MISKDQSIVTQVAAKIASELTCKTDLNEGSMANIQSTFLSHFDFVNEVLQGAHGRKRSLTLRLRITSQCQPRQ